MLQRLTFAPTSSSSTPSASSVGTAIGRYCLICQRFTVGQNEALLVRAAVAFEHPRGRGKGQTTPKPRVPR
jgi:hypothetical protein